MADTEKITAPRLLLVEGWDDGNFIKRLLDKLSGEYDEFNKELFQVINYEGVTNLRSRLAAIKLTTNNFDTVTHLGILRDAEYQGNPFMSIRDALKANGMPEPAQSGEIAGNELKIAIFLFPDNQSQGMLEDLCLQAFAGDDIVACISEYLDCLSDRNIEFVESALPKSKINILIASKSLDKSIRSDDRKVWRLSDAVNKRWWPWDHPAFDRIKSFLHQLAQ